MFSTNKHLLITLFTTSYLFQQNWSFGFLQPYKTSLLHSIFGDHLHSIFHIHLQHHNSLLSFNNNHSSLLSHSSHTHTHMCTWPDNGIVYKQVESTASLSLSERLSFLCIPLHNYPISLSLSLLPPTMIMYKDCNFLHLSTSLECSLKGGKTIYFYQLLSITFLHSFPTINRVTTCTVSTVSIFS